MKVKVTQENIDQGTICPYDCPISLAIKNNFWFPKLHKVITDIGYCYINGKKYKLPDEARIFVRDFDNGHHVEPFTFIMRRSP